MVERINALLDDFKREREELANGDIESIVNALVYEYEEKVRKELVEERDKALYEKDLEIRGIEKLLGKVILEEAKKVDVETEKVDEDLAKVDNVVYIDGVNINDVVDEPIINE